MPSRESVQATECALTEQWLTENRDRILSRLRDVRTEDLMMSDVRTEEPEITVVRTEDLETTDVRTEEPETTDVRTEDLEITDVRTEDLEITDVRTEEPEITDVRMEDLQTDARTEEVRTEIQARITEELAAMTEIISAKMTETADLTAERLSRKEKLKNRETVTGKTAREITAVMIRPREWRIPKLSKRI